MSSASNKIINERIEEISSNILILKEKLETLRAEIELLSLEREKLSAHLGVVSDSGVDSDVDRVLGNPASGVVNGVQRNAGRRGKQAVKPGSIKDEVLNVLRGNPGGLMALDILREINGSRSEPLERTSLSPQLSRLQRDGFIINERGVWRMVPTDRMSAQRKVDLD